MVLLSLGVFFCMGGSECVSVCEWVSETLCVSVSEFPCVCVCVCVFVCLCVCLTFRTFNSSVQKNRTQPTNQNTPFTATETHPPLDNRLLSLATAWSRSNRRRCVLLVETGG